MIYKVLDAEPTQTSTGKPMKRLDLEGVEKKINIFSDFPHYADIQEGSTIDAEIRKNDKGYDNLYSNEIKPRGGAGGAFKQKVIEESMERKEKSISHFQDNKEWGIKMASTLRMAVDLTIAEKDTQRETTLQETIRKWRSWLLKEWDIDPKDVDPF